jgi:hypothetical protein
VWLGGLGGGCGCELGKEKWCGLGAWLCVLGRKGVAVGEGVWLCECGSVG